MAKSRMAGDKGKELADACWKDYEAFGLKRGKGGKMVPDCKPKEEKG